MKTFYKVFLQLLFATIFSLNLNAQEATTTSGGEATGSRGNSSYTVGQTNYTTMSGTNGFVAQGVQQPYETSVVTAIDGTENIKLYIKAFPNPTTNMLVLSIDNHEYKKLTYQLFDISGKMLLKSIITENETTIDLGSYPASTYLLRIMDGNKELKNFKIIKN